MKDLKVLELNADFTPLNLVPLSTITWQKAFKKIIEGVAVPVSFYKDEWVRTPTTKYKVPSVIALANYKAFKVHAKWSKFNVKLRDNFTCQYCMTRFSHRSLTIDHIKPKSHGGKHSWKNSVTACKRCNQAKKNDANIRPKRMPRQPTYYELAVKMLKFKEIKHPEWKLYVQHIIK